MFVCLGFLGVLSLFGMMLKWGEVDRCLWNVVLLVVMKSLVVV